jgi:hypothetical protein
LGLFLQNLGSAIGIAVCSTVVNNSLNTCLLSVLSPDLTKEVTESTTFIRSGSMTPQQEADTIHCYVSSFRTAWCVIASLASLSFLATLFIKQYSLFKTQENMSLVAKEVVLEEAEENSKTC